MASNPRHLEIDFLAAFGDPTFETVVQIRVRNLTSEIIMLILAMIYEHRRLLDLQ